MAASRRFTPRSTAASCTSAITRSTWPSVEAHAIEPIDMVVVNLYAFEKTASKPGVAFSEVIENIDIGGPSMVRSAAKNFEDVAVVTSAADYAPLAEELAANSGSPQRAPPAGGWRAPPSPLPPPTTQASLPRSKALPPLRRTASQRSSTPPRCHQRSV